jgi:hypothetical protein
MALVNAAGTLLSKTPGGTVLESVAETDPQIRVKVNVYRDTPYDNVDYPTQMKQLAFRAGQIIRQSKWDAEFTAPTISGITPAVGPAAGGTAVTVTGTGFTTGATVAVGGTAGTSVVVVSDEKLTFATPAKTAGAYDVTVTTAGGTATEEDGFTYE